MLQFSRVVKSKTGSQSPNPNIKPHSGNFEIESKLMKQMRKNELNAKTR